MSAPHTDLEKQEKQHRPALFGMGFSVLWAVVLLAGLAIWVFANGNEPEGAAQQVDGRTGAIEQTEGTAPAPNQ